MLVGFPKMATHCNNKFVIFFSVDVKKRKIPIYKILRSKWFQIIAQLYLNNKVEILITFAQAVDNLILIDL